MPRSFQVSWPLVPPLPTMLGHQHRARPCISPPNPHGAAPGAGTRRFYGSVSCHVPPTIGWSLHPGGGQRFLANPGLEAVPCARLLGFGRDQLCTGGTLEAAAWRCHLLGDNKRHGQKWGLVAWGEGRAGWGMGHPTAWVLSGSRMDLGAHGTGGALWWQGAPRVLHSSWRAPSHHPHPSWGAKPPKMGSFSLYFWLFRGPETPREGQECPPAL